MVEAILTPGPQGGPGQRLKGEHRNPGGVCVFSFFFFNNWWARWVSCEKVNVALERKGLFISKETRVGL